MAKIIEENIVIKLSRIVKDKDEAVTLATEELTTTLETVAAELLGDGVVVEAMVA